MYLKVIAVGNLGRDPEMRYLDDGRAMCTFSLAVNFFSGKEKHVMWIRVLTFEKTAEQCSQYLKKGRAALCEGRFIADPATGAPKLFQKKDGTTATSFEMVASSVTFLGDRESGHAETQNAKAEVEVVEDGEFPVF